MKNIKEKLLEEIIKASHVVNTNYYNEGMSSNTGISITERNLRSVIDNIVEENTIEVPSFVLDYLDSYIPFSKYEKVLFLIQSYNGDYYHLTEMLPEGGFIEPNEGERLHEWAGEQELEMLFNLTDSLYTNEEIKYKVLIGEGEYDNGLYLVKDLSSGEVSYGTNLTYFQQEPREIFLTEKEIKDFDERLWQFVD